MVCRNTHIVIRDTFWTAPCFLYTNTAAINYSYNICPIRDFKRDTTASSSIITK